MIAVRPKQQETMEVRFATTMTKPKASYFTDDDSAGSSEEVESPRSVGRWRRLSTSRKVAYVHSQILRIREEDSHLGESSFAVKDRITAVDVVLFARPVLPSSPLKNTVNAFN